MRGRPGTDDEQVGLFHVTVRDYLSAGHTRYAIDIRQGHGAIREAIDELAPMEQHDPGHPLHRYAAQMEPEHRWATGEHSAVISSLTQRESVIPFENLQRWGSWKERFETEVGKAHPETLRARTGVVLLDGTDR